MKDLLNFKKIKAFSLTELVLTIGLASIIVLSVISFSLEASRYNLNKWERVNAGIKINELVSTLQALKNDSWKSIMDIPFDQPKHLALVNNRLSILDGSDAESGLNISFTLKPVYRDSSLNIVTSGGTIDYGTKNAEISVTWTDSFGELNTVSNNIYLTNWNTTNLTETTTLEFNDGTKTGTFVDSTIGDGAVRLQSVLYSDWCRPEFTQTTYNLPGSGIPTLISSIPGKAYLGSSSTTSSLQGIDINHTTNPAVVNVQGTFTGYETKSIFSDGNYAYLATTNDSKEVVIVNVTTTPFTEVGYFNASGTTDAESVYIKGNVGYVIQGKELRSFDLTSKTGSRPQLSSITVAKGLYGFFVGIASEIEIRGNYAFISLYNDWYELVVVNITNPSSMSLVGNSDVNYQQSNDLFVNEDGSRVYIGTTSASSSNEFFIIDTSVKKNGMPVIGSYDTNGMSVNGVTVIDNKAIIVGANGEEYQVVNIENNNNLVRCGGLNTDIPLNGVTSVVTPPLNERFTYVISNDANSEFRIIKGGDNSGVSGNGYMALGEYTSNIIDIGTSKVYYYLLKWTETVPALTDLKFQIKTGNQSNLSDGVWVGPDGTSSTYFTNNNGEVLPSILHGKRYIQYKAFFTSDKISTPLLTDITLNYGK